VTLISELPAPTPNASLGWGQIRTSGGITGFVSREFLTTTDPSDFQTRIVTLADQPMMTATEEGGGVLKAIVKNIPSIQMVLNAVMGTSLPISGQLDAATVKVVKAFQASQGLSQDGNPGPLTVAALNKKLGV
jgi:murein L,D-transpeptidase YcbB/YkuD